MISVARLLFTHELNRQISFQRRFQHGDRLYWISRFWQRYWSWSRGTPGGHNIRHGISTWRSQRWWFGGRRELNISTIAKSWSLGVVWIGWNSIGCPWDISATGCEGGKGYKLGRTRRSSGETKSEVAASSISKFTSLFIFRALQDWNCLVRRWKNIGYNIKDKRECALCKEGRNVDSKLRSKKRLSFRVFTYCSSLAFVLSSNFSRK